MDITQYLLHMAEKGASDLYFSTGSPVLMKIEGATFPVNADHIMPPGAIHRLAYNLMQDHHTRQFEADWEANLAVSLNNVGRFRINVLRQRGEVSMVVRHIKTHPPSLEALHLPMVLKPLVSEQRGLILVAGATGSGKSSTLAAMIDYRNQTRHGHILTIEDPIEYLHPYKKSIVNQREVGTDTKSFASALRNAMREAPDVILIGEIRDEETMHSAITYSETGHLCLATIHASNAIETLDRALNFFPERRHKQVLTDLSRNLKAVICQRLIRGKDKRRWPAIELLLNSPYIAELIQKGELDEIREAMSRRAENGTLCFDDALLTLYQQKLITREDAIAHADSKHNLTVKIRLLEHGKIDPATLSAGSHTPLSLQDDPE